MKKNKISIAIVKSVNNQFLISFRPKGVHQGEKWEFPGGKTEKGELTDQAMRRELLEETGLVALEYQLLESISFDYDDLALDLYFYLVTEFSGEAQGKEDQLIKWVSKEDLLLHEFPDANKTVIEKL